MVDVSTWINVVTDPLGLAGFALFLVFGFLAKVGLAKGQQWLTISAVSMAAIALIGGMLLSWQRNEATHLQENATPSVSEHPSGETRQTTHGEQSPAVQNVKGNVTIKIESLDDNKE